MNLDITIIDRKAEVLQYFRDRASEYLTTIKQRYSETEFAKRAKAINETIIESKNQVIQTLLQKATAEGWTNEEKLKSVLLITYCNIVVMIESRNSVRPYEYMDFSRRVGELWDPFCKLCFYHSIKDVTLFVPPLFSEVKGKLSNEIDEYIDSLHLTPEQKADLKIYYNKVWGLVTSGEIQMELDLHFIYEGKKYVVDFKSGFGSNEKGNLNRLLLVASIYKSYNEEINCLILVRSEENNSYYNILKDSGVWKANCGALAYSEIQSFTGFNLREWIDTNVNWVDDFNMETSEHLREKKLLGYLLW